MYLAAHVLVATILIATIYAIQWFLRKVGDPTLFDTVPIRYMFDAMDAGILVVFIAYGVRAAMWAFR